MSKTVQVTWHDFDFLPDVSSSGQDRHQDLVLVHHEVVIPHEAGGRGGVRSVAVIGQC